ncbi:MAG: DUF2851 family protein [Ktedonobacteraceae bacterium]
MKMLLLRERGEQESDIARSWWRLPPQTLLPLVDGQRCLLLYNGQPGGSAGPDVRDAVLRFLEKQAEEAQCVGDVEFHTYASDWYTHKHQNDPRYNRVVLHVVLVLDSQFPTRRQDGSIVPTCSLLDLPRIPEQVATWPCQHSPLPADQLTATLLSAGLLRFNEKSQALHQTLVAIQPQPNTTSFDAYDKCLLPALAEGLGYGRDRAFFRAVGLRLVGLPTHIPEPLGHTQTPAPLDARRLRILYTLSARWQQAGAWRTLRQLCQQPKQDVKMASMALRKALRPLSQARSDILICNVILPFAAAVATLENNPRLASWAHQLYLAYPGLVSNRVTRTMSTQLQLPEEPSQASLQQGLHYIYAQTCQAKDCQMCVCGGQRL